MQRYASLRLPELGHITRTGNSQPPRKHTQITHNQQAAARFRFTVIVGPIVFKRTSRREIVILPLLLDMN